MAVMNVKSFGTANVVTKRIGSVRPVISVRPSILARSAPETETAAPAAEQQPVAATSSPAKAEFSLLNKTNEAINARASMLGVLSALGVEAFSHHSVFSQLAGRYENQELVEKSFGGSVLAMGMIIALVTVGTLAPRMLENKSVDSKSYGPFTPQAEILNGRLAMMGFLALLVIEAVKGSSLL